MRVRTLLLAAVLASATVALLPAAAACTYTPLVTAGGPNYPSDGAYVEEDCYGYSGTVRLTVTLPAAAGECVVPPLFVLGQQVPGTGVALCPGGAYEVDVPAFPDVGVVVCAGTLRCSIVSPNYLHWTCANLGPQSGQVTCSLV